MFLRTTTLSGHAPIISSFQYSISEVSVHYRFPLSRTICGARVMEDNLYCCQCPACVSGEDRAKRLLHRQLNVLLLRLDEQQRRWVAAWQSKKIGYGGDTLI